jgi:hypothetical protein
VDLFMGQDAFMNSDPLLDEAAAMARHCLESRLLGCVHAWFQPQSRIPGWTPPSSDLLAAWFRDGGFKPVIDGEGNLRLTLKRRGCDGQILVERREEGRLRICMPLGRWKILSRTSEAAALLLAGEANARGRLVRVAWMTEGALTRCEAQVDLSGLPWSEFPDRPTMAMWKGTIRMSMLALKLTLLRLGLELPLLCDEKHAAVKDWIFKTPRTAL